MEVGFGIRVSMAAIILGAHVVHAGPAMHPLSEKELRQQVIGREVTDGAHWADRYLPDGRAEGHSLGKAYVGSWTIDNDELCLTRQAKRLRTECFQVWLSGTRVEYRRGGVALASGTLHTAGVPNRRR